MAKTPRLPSTRSARLDASSYRRHLPRRLRIASNTLAAQAPSDLPLTPSEFFVKSLHEKERDAGLDTAAACPGANIQVLLKMHVEKKNHAPSATPTHLLVVHIETPLPSGGTHTACLDSWKKGTGGAPLWLVDIPDTPTSPLQFHLTLGWLYAVVSVIEARPARCDGDVWWRLLLFVNNVKEAYRAAPLLNTLSSVRPRPRPRPRHAALNDLADALAALQLSGGDGRIAHKGV